MTRLVVVGISEQFHILISKETKRQVRDTLRTKNGITWGKISSRFFSERVPNSKQEVTQRCDHFRYAALKGASFNTDVPSPRFGRWGHRNYPQKYWVICWWPLFLPYILAHFWHGTTFCISCQGAGAGVQGRGQLWAKPTFTGGIFLQSFTTGSSHFSMDKVYKSLKHSFKW